MKALFLSLLFLSVVVCIPFNLKDEQDCSFCENMHLLGDCNCDDVNWCRGVQCNVPAKCDEKCDTDDTPPEEEKKSKIRVQEPEIIQFTTPTVRVEFHCSFCERKDLLGACNCDDVQWCHDEHCIVPAKCYEKCPIMVSRGD